jgi:hypothetical protein
MTPATVVISATTVMTTTVLMPLSVGQLAKRVVSKSPSNRREAGFEQQRYSIDTDSNKSPATARSTAV